MSKYVVRTLSKIGRPILKLFANPAVVRYDYYKTHNRRPSYDDLSISMGEGVIYSACYLFSLAALRRSIPFWDLNGIEAIVNALPCEILPWVTNIASGTAIGVYDSFVSWRAERKYKISLKKIEQHDRRWLIKDRERREKLTRKREDKERKAVLKELFGDDG